ncbi:hypothetical protein KY332_03180 [Candidatus Woesearchaeota archaeon]|nr:hypothetical protein [Candidatus Woesearchaeota archaeon]
MKKKAIMYEFLVRLIIAVLMVTAAIIIGKSFFRLTSEGMNSYHKLVGVIEDIEPPELKSTSLAMDKETMIVVFNENIDPIVADSEVAYKPGIAALPAPYSLLNSKVQVSRPASCDINQNCVCLIRDVEKTGNVYDLLTVKYEEAVCNPVEHTFMQGDIENGRIVIYRPRQIVPRDRTVWIENRNNILAMCLSSPPCFPE